MTLQAISKGFEYYKKFGLNFTIKILPLIFLFGFLASVGSSSSFSDGISNFDIFLLLINNFLISPLLTIIAIFIANDLIEKNNRDVLVYYAISWQFLLRVLILSLISTLELITVAATPTNSVTLPNEPKPSVLETSKVSLSPTL